MVSHKEIYERAADIVERCGWTKGHYRWEDDRYVKYGEHTENTAHCTVGAIESACAEYDLDFFEALEFTRNDFYKPLEEVTGSSKITDWNDELAIDAYDVADHLRKAAELCDEV